MALSVRLWRKCSNFYFTFGTSNILATPFIKYEDKKWFKQESADFGWLIGKKSNEVCSARVDRWASFPLISNCNRSIFLRSSCVREVMCQPENNTHFFSFPGFLSFLTFLSHSIAAHQLSSQRLLKCSNFSWAWATLPFTQRISTKW